MTDEEQTEQSILDDLRSRSADAATRWRRQAPWRLVLIFASVGGLGVVMLVFPEPFVTDGYRRFALRSVREVRLVGAIALAVGIYATISVYRRPRS